MTTARRPLLFLVAHASDPHTVAATATLAALAGRAGWAFDCYLDRGRSGRHFGGGDPATMTSAAWAGSLVAGAHHAEHVSRLADAYDVVAAGDARSPVWPALTAAGATVLLTTDDPAALYEAVLDRLGLDVPHDVFVVDASPQGACSVVAAPYVIPAFLRDGPALGLDVRADDALCARVDKLGASRYRGLAVDPSRVAGFPRVLDGRDLHVGDGDYATFTSRLAHEYRDWGTGVLLGGPDLVAAQAPKLARLRLLPVYGTPQTGVLARCEDVVRDAREPVYGVQYDDHDFFALGRLGHGLQVIDPDPPFDAEVVITAPLPEPPCALEDVEPSDDELRAWATDGRVLVSLVFWAGMVRELDCVTRILDLVTATGLRGGLVLTAESVEHAGTYPLALLSVEAERGGAFGLLEPLVGCTGRGVAAEALMPPGTLGTHLRDATAALGARLPSGLAVRGWWPLFDTDMARTRVPVGWRDGKPVLFTAGRANPVLQPPPRDGPGGVGGLASVRTRVKSRVRDAALRTGVRDVFGHRRPYDDTRPGAFRRDVAVAVRDAGLAYMFTKAGFGTPRVVHRDGPFVALPFTAGRWDGWSPFYTLGSAADLRRAERRLTRRAQPGWLVSTIDSPLWAMSGEVWEHGATLFELADLAARGGASGRLVNTTPNVVARYARMLDDGPTGAP